MKWYEYFIAIPCFIFSSGIFWAAVLIAGLGTCLVLAEMHSQKHWKQFVVEHDCKIISKVRSEVHTITTISTDGNVGVGLASTPAKTGWLCNDSITYWR